MSRLPTLLLVAVGLLSAVACDAPTEPRVALTLFSAVQVPYPTPPQDFAARASGDTVFIDGGILTPYWCYGFDARAQRQGDRLRVTLTAAPNSDGCLAIGGWWNYRITVLGLEPGPWRLDVRHRLLPPGESEPVFEDIVTVPVAP